MRCKSRTYPYWCVKCDWTRLTCGCGDEEWVVVLVGDCTEFVIVKRSGLKNEFWMSLLWTKETVDRLEQRCLWTMCGGRRMRRYRMHQFYKIVKIELKEEEEWIIWNWKFVKMNMQCIMLMDIAHIVDMMRRKNNVGSWFMFRIGWC